MKESLIHSNRFFPTDQKTMIVTDPCESSFDNITAFVSAQRASILHFLYPIAAMRSNQLNTPLSQPLPQLVAICSFIINKALYFFTVSAFSISGNKDGGKRLLNQGNFRRSCRVQVDCQRSTFAICQHHPLRTLSAFGFSDEWAPFFAEAKLPSMNVSAHRNFPRSSSIPRNARQIFSHTPFSSHSFSLRQQVEGDGKWGGRSSHRAPLLATQRIPSRQPRFAILFRPPRLVGFCSRGRKGLIFLHCRSVNSDRYLGIQCESSFHLFKDSHYRQFIFMSNSLSRNKLQNRF